MPVSTQDQGVNLNYRIPPEQSGGNSGAKVPVPTQDQGVNSNCRVPPEQSGGKGSEKGGKKGVKIKSKNNNNPKAKKKKIDENPWKTERF